MNNNISSVTIRPTKDKLIEVNWEYSVHHKKKDSGKIICYIPSFGIHFSCTSDAEIEKKSRALTKVFFDYFFIHKKNLGLLGLQLHKLGFRAPNDAYVIKEMISKQSVSTKFNSAKPQIPIEFVGTESIKQDSRMEVAF